MNVSKQKAFLYQESPLFNKVLRGGWVMEIVSGKVFRLILPAWLKILHWSPTISEENLWERGLKLPNNNQAKRFWLSEKLRKFIPWIRMSTLERLSHQEVPMLDGRVDKIDDYFNHKNFTKNLSEDIEDWLSVDELVSNASQVQGVSFSHAKKRFWFWDYNDWSDTSLTLLQKLQFLYAACRMGKILESLGFQEKSKELEYYSLEPS